VEPEDTEPFKAEHGILAGVAYQKFLECEAWQAGGGRQQAPAQRMTDFLKGRDSSSLQDSSYYPGLNAAPVHELLPEGIAGRIQVALRHFGKAMKGYVTEEANLVGFETRTSSPARIPRDENSLVHPDIDGLYPCGEGAGFAGGIVSAALDGMRCSEAAVGQRTA
jgi:uncharacterized FAD-dependent dehydrogenase